LIYRSKKMKPEIAAILIVIWNLVVFFTYGLDKRKARLRDKRISEKTLILMAMLMGSVGAMLGMSIFRHKTRHLKFKVGVPLTLFLNIGIIILWRVIERSRTI